MAHSELLERIKQTKRRLKDGVATTGEIVRVLDDVAAALEGGIDPVTSVLQTLTYSETKAMLRVLDQLPEATGGVLVASRIAEEFGVTRSTVVNALRKFASGGVIETRSLGMKGTLVRLLHGLTVDTLRKRIEAYKRGAA